MTRYLNSLAAHDPKMAPLADTARFTEDAVVMKIGDGAWKTVTALRPYRLDIVDVPQGVVAVHAVLEENAKPVLFTARLKVVNRRITEIESIVARSQAEAMLFAPENLKAPTDTMTYRPTGSEKMTREQMVSVAARYPAGLKAGSFVTADLPVAPGAYRIENGVKMAGPGCTFQPPSCENIRTQRIPTLAGLTQRLVAVDEDLGVVLFRLAFGPGSLFGPGSDGKGLVTFEAFKVYGGQLHAAEAVFEAEPLNQPSGWD
jgi:hypothetical protein